MTCHGSRFSAQHVQLGPSAAVPARQPRAHACSWPQRMRWTHAQRATITIPDHPRPPRRNLNCQETTSRRRPRYACVVAPVAGRQATADSHGLRTAGCTAAPFWLLHGQHSQHRGETGGGSSRRTVHGAAGLARGGPDTHSPDPPPQPRRASGRVSEAAQRHRHRHESRHACAAGEGCCYAALCRTRWPLVAGRGMRCGNQLWSGVRA